MLKHAPAVWVQEAQNLNENLPEKVLMLIYAPSAEIAKNHVQYYQQKIKPASLFHWEYYL
ncbi:hypothetical protein [Aggregatibacter actinomycetemcomitans]|nr:hypothetical protein [Aggregatibacter actinomycetemcomitans]AAM88348.1 unknown [Aggregatibacter actinomycetemcomitans]BAS47671.1 hypothetical protein AANUM_0440 [Aggregatibacter actinomycetemcomitans NUM4039]BAS47776.1 hypothetical protein AANUM_0545 [Aggregatibacter actinomycetemcomitans NUM4039]